MMLNPKNIGVTIYEGESPDIGAIQDFEQIWVMVNGAQFLIGGQNLQAMINGAQVELQIIEAPVRPSTSSLGTDPLLLWTWVQPAAPPPDPPTVDEIMAALSVRYPAITDHKKYSVVPY